MDKCAKSFDPAGGVDQMNALGGKIALGLSKGRFQGIKLTVDIARMNLIKVHQTQSPNPCTGKTFHGITADRTESDYCNIRSGQSFQTINTDHPSYS
jgi:hypothetical protein